MPLAQLKHSRLSHVSWPIVATTSPALHRGIPEPAARLQAGCRRSQKRRSHVCTALQAGIVTLGVGELSLSSQTAVKACMRGPHSAAKRPLLLRPGQ